MLQKRLLIKTVRGKDYNYRKIAISGFTIQNINNVCIK